MLITISAQGFTLTPAIDAHVRGRLEDALHTFTTSVASVDVYLRDVNGPKGGIDKTALFSIRLRDGAALVIESSSADVYAAVAVSARRAKRAVRRALGKSRRVAQRELRRLRHRQIADPAVTGVG